MSYHFHLGVSDPEMKQIEQILIQESATYSYAMSGGERVHPGNAYRCDPVQLAEGELVLIECEPVSLPERFIRLDHHRPGDPGYGRKASEYWQASSIGQLCHLLSIEPTQEMLVLAAMDHCPAAAIRGECPGVSAEEVIERKVIEIANATKRTHKEVRERIAFYSQALQEAPSIKIAEHSLLDMRAYYLGEGYSLELRAAQVAVLAGGYTVLLCSRDALGEELPEKWSISGHATPELIQEFKERWAPAQGLVGIYGVPDRGYAGGYVPKEGGNDEKTY